MPVITMVSRMCTLTCMHANVNACYVLACTGPYISLIGSDQGDRYLRKQEEKPVNTMVSVHRHKTMHARVNSHISFACMSHILVQLRQIKSSRYLWNQGKIPVLSDYTMWPKHISLHACTLLLHALTCTSNKLGQIREIKDSMKSEIEIEHTIWSQTYKLMCIHDVCT